MGHGISFDDLVNGCRSSLRSICGTYSNVFERYDEPIPSHSLLISNPAMDLSIPDIDFYDCMLPPEEATENKIWK